MTAIALAPASDHAPGGRIYVWLAGVAAVIAFGAFLPTYWAQVPAGTFKGSPLLHVHAVLFSAWTLLFLLQAVLATRGKLRRHRAFGLAGVSLATAMVAVGIAVALERLQVGLAAGYGDRVRAFLIIQVSGMLLFAGLFAAAVAMVGRPDWHRRLMLAATASLLQAPLARIPFLLITGGGPGVRPGLVEPPPVAVTIAPSMAVNLLLVAGLIHDVRTRGRPHPAYPVGLAAIAIVTLLRAPLSRTDAWYACADWLARIAT